MGGTCTPYRLTRTQRSRPPGLESAAVVLFVVGWRLLLVDLLLTLTLGGELFAFVCEALFFELL